MTSYLFETTKNGRRDKNRQITYLEANYEHLMLYLIL